MKFQLRNESTGEIHFLDKDRISVGAVKGNSIVIKGPGMPPTQCFLIRVDQGYSLMNFYPQRFVVVNGRKIDEKDLEPGDQIRFAKFSFIFEEAGAEPPPSRSPGEKADPLPIHEEPTVQQPVMTHPGEKAEKGRPAPPEPLELESAPTMELDDETDGPVEEEGSPGGRPGAEDPGPTPTLDMEAENLATVSGEGETKKPRALELESYSEVADIIEKAAFGPEAEAEKPKAAEKKPVSREKPPVLAKKKPVSREKPLVLAKKKPGSKEKPASPGAKKAVSKKKEKTPMEKKPKKPKQPIRSRPGTSRKKGIPPVVWIGGGVVLLAGVVIALVAAGVFSGPEKAGPADGAQPSEREGTPAGVSPTGKPGPSKPGDVKDRAYLASWSAAEEARTVAEEKDSVAEWDKVIEAAEKARSEKETGEVRTLLEQAKGRRGWALAREAESRDDLEEAIRLASQAGTVGAPIQGLPEYLSGLKAKKAEREESTRRKEQFDIFERQAEEEEAKGAECDPEVALSLWKKALECAGKREDRERVENRISSLSQVVEYSRAMGEVREALKTFDYEGAVAGCERALQSKPDDPDARSILEQARNKLSGKPCLVVVVVGGDVTDPEIGFGDPGKKDIPRIWNEIRPGGAFVPVVKSLWATKRTMWVGEFLTGTSFKGLVSKDGAFRFKAPTVLDLFGRISGSSAREVWLLTRGDEKPIIYDSPGLEGEPAGARFVPIAVTGARVREKNFDFADDSAGDFVRRAVAELEDGTADSDAFLLDLGARLLGDPLMAPRLAIIRFGGIPGIREVGDAERRKALMAEKMRMDDEACFRLWKAFRANPLHAKSGTFVVVNQFGGALFVGPGIKVGTVSKACYLHQFAPTLARILGYDIGEFFRPSVVKPKAPMVGIFVE